MRTIVVYGPQGKSFLGLWLKQWAYRNGHAAFIDSEICVDLNNAIVAGNIAFLTDNASGGWQVMYLDQNRLLETCSHRHDGCHETCASDAAILQLEQLLGVPDVPNLATSLPKPLWEARQIRRRAANLLAATRREK